jgi:hypothetical protein
MVDYCLSGRGDNLPHAIRSLVILLIVFVTHYLSKIKTIIAASTGVKRLSEDDI